LSLIIRQGRAAGDATGTGGPALLDGARLALAAIRGLVNLLVLALLAFMAVAILSQIVGRYVFNYSIAWSEEIATFAQVWLVLLGAGVAMRHNGHVGVDVLIRKMPLALQRFCVTASFLLGAWFLGVVVVGSLSLVTIGLIVKSPAMQVPMAVPYLSLPVGFGYFLLEFALASLPRIVSRTPFPADHPEEVA